MTNLPCAMGAIRETRPKVKVVHKSKQRPAANWRTRNPKVSTKVRVYKGPQAARKNLVDAIIAHDKASKE